MPPALITAPADHAVDDSGAPWFDLQVARDQAVMVQADARRHGHVANTMPCRDVCRSSVRTSILPVI